MLFYALRQSSFLTALVQGDLPGIDVPTPFVITTVLLPFLASVLLWFFPMIVAKSILKPELDQEIQPFSADELLTALILGISLYFLYYAIIDGVYWLTVFQASDHSPYSQPSGEQKANMIATAIEFVVSVGLIMKARTVARSMMKFAQ
jgi:hypothetical protein